MPDTTPQTERKSSPPEWWTRFHVENAVTSFDMVFLAWDGLEPHLRENLEDGDHHMLDGFRLALQQHTEALEKVKEAAEKVAPSFPAYEPEPKQEEAQP